MKNTQPNNAPIYVSSSDELNAAIVTANEQTKNDLLTIILQVGFAAQSSDITPICTQGTLIIQSADGKPLDIDGANTYRGFAIQNGNVTLENLNIKNMIAKGAEGCMGAGAGLFVSNTSGYPSSKVQFAPTVTLTNVSFLNCKAQGGDVTSCASGGSAVGGGDDGSGPGGNPGSYGLNYNANAGMFSWAGTGGAGGAAGGGGSAGAGSGGQGGIGGTGGASGYGAGAAAGGGGGGGGGGASGYCEEGHYQGMCLGPHDSGAGGAGAQGGDAGNPGFGGGSSARATNGQPGGGSNSGGDEAIGGNGGAGGNGAPAGGGAGFGGAIFIMDNANVTITGSGTISGNTVVGGVSAGAPVNGSAAGSGVYLQGSGKFNFNLAAQDIYTIDDDIIDEAGAVKNGMAVTVVGTTGPDGLPTGGGTGIWSINQTGKGKLVINGRNLLSGKMKVNGDY